MGGGITINLRGIPATDTDRIDTTPFLTHTGDIAAIWMGLCQKAELSRRVQTGA